jgi:hypothetical protein
MAGARVPAPASPMNLKDELTQGEAAALVNVGICSGLPDHPCGCARWRVRAPAKSTISTS